eukprot:NODE_1_length_95616_cov_0.657642.p5 type:complete len:639 gc:universal NODE_1_length_95616_cov_0.657642:55589-53673(-)
MIFINFETLKHSFHYFMDPVEYHRVFSSYLGEKIDPSTRTNARQKLTLLSENQFGELATDIHDELKRRISSENIPFLQVRSDYHPKRNQARQKLATLPEKRFKDLVIDVIIELERRFPQLVQNESAISEVATKQNNANVESQNSNPIAGPQRTNLNTGGNNLKNQAGSNDLNFASLDSLMKDLGDLVTQNNDSPNKSYNKNTEASNSLESLPKSEDLAKIRKEKEMLEKKYKLLEGDFEKERSKLQLCQKELNTASIELQRVKSDLESFSTRKGVVEKELERSKELLEKEKSLKFTIEQKLTSREFELTERNKVIKNMEFISSENQKALEQVTSQNSKLKVDNDKLRLELNDLRNKVVDSNEKGSVPISINTENEKFPEKQENKLKSPIKPEKPVVLKSEKIGKPNARATVDMSQLPWDIQRKTTVVSQILENVTIEDVTPSKSGGVDPSRLGAYQNSVDTLLDSQKSGVPSDILVSMKAIVIACKNITNDVEKFEAEASNEHRDALSTLKGQLSASLTLLMSAAKNHATGLAKGSVKGSSEEIDKGCLELTIVIINILKIVKFKSLKDDENIPLKKLQDIMHNTPDTSPIKNAPLSSMSSSDLKVTSINLGIFRKTDRCNCYEHTATAVSDENWHVW